MSGEDGTLRAWRVYDGESWAPVLASSRWEATRFHPNVGRGWFAGDCVTRSAMRVTRLPHLDGVGGPARELWTVHMPCPGDHGGDDRFCDDPFCWEGETVDWDATIAINSAPGPRP